MVRSSSTLGQGPGFEPIDGRFQCAWHYIKWVITVPATMQDLHEDPPSFSVHCFGYYFVFLGMPRALHARSVWTQYTPTIGADAR